MADLGCHIDGKAAGFVGRDREPDQPVARCEVDADGLLLEDLVAPVRDDAIDGRVLRHGHVTAVAVADEAGEDEHGEAGQDQASEDELLTTGHRMIVPDFASYSEPGGSQLHPHRAGKVVARAWLRLGDLVDAGDEALHDVDIDLGVVGDRQ